MNGFIKNTKIKAATFGILGLNAFAMFSRSSQEWGVYFW